MAAMLKPADVAAELNCSPGHVRRLCRRGELRAMRLGSDWRVSADDLAVYVAAHTTRPTAAPVQQPARTATSPAVLTVVGEMDGALPDRWWETTTAAPALSAGGSGRSARTKKARSVRR